MKKIDENWRYLNRFRSFAIRTASAATLLVITACGVGVDNGIVTPNGDGTCTVDATLSDGTVITGAHVQPGSAIEEYCLAGGTFEGQGITEDGTVIAGTFTQNEHGVRVVLYGHGSNWGAYPLCDAGINDSSDGVLDDYLGLNDGGEICYVGDFEPAGETAPLMCSDESDFYNNGPEKTVNIRVDESNPDRMWVNLPHDVCDLLQTDSGGNMFGLLEDGYSPDGYTPFERGDVPWGFDWRRILFTAGSIDTVVREIAVDDYLRSINQTGTWFEISGSGLTPDALFAKLGVYSHEDGQFSFAKTFRLNPMILNITYGGSPEFSGNGGNSSQPAFSIDENGNTICPYVREGFTAQWDDLRNYTDGVVEGGCINPGYVPSDDPAPENGGGEVTMPTPMNECVATEDTPNNGGYGFNYYTQMGCEVNPGNNGSGSGGDNGNTDNGNPNDNPVDECVATEDSATNGGFGFNFATQQGCQLPGSGGDNGNTDNGQASYGTLSVGHNGGVVTNQLIRSDNTNDEGNHKLYCRVSDVERSGWSENNPDFGWIEEVMEGCVRYGSAFDPDNHLPR